MQKELEVAIIEDDADDREFIENALIETRPGVRVVAFRLATVFVGELEKRNIRPDIIVTDLRMPHMNGFELINSVKSNKETSMIPVVVLSTSGNDKDKQLAKDLGAQAYFVKPYSVEGFAEISRDILRNFPTLQFSGTFLQVLSEVFRLRRATTA